MSACQSDGGVYLAVLTAAQRSSLAGVQRSPWKSEIVNYTTAPEVDAGWEKISVTFTPDTSGTYSLAFVQDKADGTAYCDDMQLEAHAAASNANLVQNGTFASGAPDFWTANRYTKSSEHPLGAGKGVSMHAEGSSVGGTRTSQVVPINYYAGLATFLLSGWGKANSVGGTSPKPEKDGERYFGLIAEIKYAKEDGTEISETENQYVSFNDDFTDWQYASGVIIPKRRDLMVKNITVYCAYDYNANDAYFTNISLVLEPAETYSYDSKGNPIAATDGNAKTSSEFFANSQRLKSYTTPGGAKHTLAYDTRNNLEQDTLAGLTNYTYHNTSGSATTSITSVGTSGDYLKSYNVYDSTGRFRTQSTDANGVTTEYEYEPGAARLFRSTAANGTKQGFHYADNSDRVDFTYIDHTASIDYDYDRAQLTDLIRKAFPQAAPASGQNVNPFWQHYLLGYDTFGNMTRVRVCASSAERAGYTAPITLATYEYEGNVYNGRLAKMTYGNKDSVSYTYDAFDRQRTAAYNDVDRTTHEQKNVATYHYDYSSDNALTRQYATGSSGITEQYSYQYDSLGRLIHSRQSTGTGALIQSTQHMYDAANRMTSQTWQFGTGLYHQQYSYTGVKADGATDGSVDGTISAITTTVPGQSVITSTYGYNDLRQLTSKGVTVPDQNGTQTKVYDRSYTYDRIAVDSGNWMGTRLASTGYTFGSSSRSFTYTYDKAGNITKIVTDGTSVPKAAEWKEYTYDAQGQLVSEKNSSKTTFLYAYDTAGNIRSITKGGAVTKSFGYTNPSWPDLLTSVTSGSTTREIQYEGQTRSDDGVVSGDPISGNPITYYNGKEYTFTWTKGRQLASATVDGKNVTYTYDMSGVRTSKTVNGTTYNYTTLSGKVMRQQWGSKSLEFVYDDGNQPFAMIYNDGSTTTLYYYVLNAQGDVIALLNSAGSLVASYNYGAWGNYSVHGADGKKTTDATFIGHINPLRYRGYYYDRETRLYYLQSRYYDFANCRFINADTFATTDANGFLSANMFAYCENNPVGNSDPNGEFLNTFIGAATGAALGAVLALVTGENVKAAAISGAISGAVSGFAADVIIATGGSALVVAGVYGAAGALGSGLGSIAAQRAEDKPVDKGQVLTDTICGGVFGLVGGLMTGSVTPMMKQVRQAAGKKAIDRGITVGYAVKRTTRNEARKSGHTIAESLLSGFTSWYAQFRIKNLFRRK